MGDGDVRVGEADIMSGQRPAEVIRVEGITEWEDTPYYRVIESGMISRL